MPRNPGFKRAKVTIELIDRRVETWKFARKTVRGTVSLTTSATRISHALRAGPLSSESRSS
jgi:hypothetical protein